MEDAVTGLNHVLATWVSEAVLDIPCQLPPHSPPQSDSIFISLGGLQIDGFTQLRPRDIGRSSSSVFWSATAPLLFDCRAAVFATDAASALLRAQALYEHVADRLSLLTGYPARIISSGITYNEDQLIQCIAGDRTEYELTHGLDDCFRTGPIKNPQLTQVLHPPEVALEAIRWFRHGMSQSRPIDQFLSFYIALESISRHIPNVERSFKRTPTGQQSKELESQESAGIRYLASRHQALPTNTRQKLAEIRARIAHGSTNSQVVGLAFANLALVQRLAADGIALVIGVIPEDLQVLQPKFASLIVPLLNGNYEGDNHPITRWSNSLTQAFAAYLAATGQHPPNKSAKGI